MRSRLQAKSNEDEAWTYYDEPLMADLLTLRDILERKYRRRRASAEDVASLDQMIQDRNNNE